MAAASLADEHFAALRAFLEAESLSHFIGEHHHELEVLKKGTHTIKDAMALLSKHQVLSAAILDEEGEYMGAVSVPDILRGLVRNLEANLGEAYLDDLKSVSADELAGLGSFFASKDASSVLHEADLWMRGDKSTTMMAVLREGFQIEQTRVHHRIYVCDPAKATHKVSVAASAAGGPAPTVVNIPVGSEKEGASAWIPTDVVTQLDFVALFTEKALAAHVTDSIMDLGLGRTVVSTVDQETPALLAFHHMAMDHKSAVGVTDASGKLTGSISVADLRDMSADSFGLLLQPIGKLLSNGTFPNARLDTVPASISFAALIEKLSSERLHRVYVTAEDGSAQSIITLTDVLRVVSGCSIPKARRSLDIQREHEEKKAREAALAAGEGSDSNEEEDEDA